MIEQHEGETTLKVKTHLDNMVNKIFYYTNLKYPKSLKVHFYSNKSCLFHNRYIILFYYYLPAIECNRNDEISRSISRSK